MLERKGGIADASTVSFADDGRPTVFPRRNHDVFRYLLTIFQSFLPPEKAAQFMDMAEALESSVIENCQSCLKRQQPAISRRDPRRSRFLLRLVVGRVSHLFSGNRATMPRSLIEGIDAYLKKAFGPVIYEELNAEADQLLYDLNVDDDHEMWARICRNPQWRRFVDTIFIRILFRFENFDNGKKTFIHIVNATMQERSHFTFGETQFHAVFEGLFADVWSGLQNEEQRIRWDFTFGDGASKRVSAIIQQGQTRRLKPKGERSAAG